MIPKTQQEQNEESTEDPVSDIEVLPDQSQDDSETEIDSHIHRVEVSGLIPTPPSHSWIIPVTITVD